MLPSQREASPSTSSGLSRRRSTDCNSNCFWQFLLLLLLFGTRDRHRSSRFKEFLHLLLLNCHSSSSSSSSSSRDFLVFHLSTSSNIRDFLVFHLSSSNSNSITFRDSLAFHLNSNINFRHFLLLLLLPSSV